MATSPAGHRAHAAQRRRNRTTVRATDREWAQIGAAASAAGLKPGAWLMATGVRVARLRGVGHLDQVAWLEQMCTELEGLRRQSAGVAVNVNQITARLHATGELAAQTAAVLAAARRIAERADAVLDRVEGWLQ